MKSTLARSGILLVALLLAGCGGGGGGGGAAPAGTEPSLGTPTCKWDDATTTWNNCNWNS
ncbi:MAG TPA: hypothetical protein VFI80_08940 [Burkholderiales bacterium]|nr:hypothetical protein [Burkholderiales bacterium]